MRRWIKLGKSSGSIFQSTHPRGVRHVDECDAVRLVYFNPRTHVGCDVLALPLSGDAAISIHAPTWGATLRLVKNIFQFTISIHAPTWGATPTTLSICSPRLFQSTHPRGVRPLSRESGQQPRNFNPRTHVGCDRDKVGYVDSD